MGEADNKEDLQGRQRGVPPVAGLTGRADEHWELSGLALTSTWSECDCVPAAGRKVTEAGDMPSEMLLSAASPAPSALCLESITV